MTQAILGLGSNIGDKKQNIFVIVRNIKNVGQFGFFQIRKFRKIQKAFFES